MGDSFLRTINEIFFTIFPTGFFLQLLDLYAQALNFMLGLIGIQSNIVAF